MWVAWMNLENLYGSQESLVKVFEMALKENEPIDVFTRLVAIYEQTKKFDVSVFLAIDIVCVFAMTFVCVRSERLYTCVCALWYVVHMCISALKAYLHVFALKGSWLRNIMYNN